jgi:hypothetical protein
MLTAPAITKTDRRLRSTPGEAAIVSAGSPGGSETEVISAKSRRAIAVEKADVAREASAM